MHLVKYKEHQIISKIKHDLRQFSADKPYQYGNDELDLSLSKNNVKLINRGTTYKEVNAYRKKIESEIFKFANRKDYVKAIEVCIQVPNDCPKEQEKLFFQECYNFFCSYLPLGEKSIFLAEVHKDEHMFVNGVDISKNHLHLMFVPAAKITEKQLLSDTKKRYEGYEFKLSADALTRRAQLCSLHRELQAFITSKGIQATVVRKEEGKSKTISLPLKILKEITKNSNIILDHSITIEELSQILKDNVTYSKELTELKEQLMEKELELQKANEKIENIEKEKIVENTWGNTSSWGSSNSWGSKSHTVDANEKLF